MEFVVTRKVIGIGKSSLGVTFPKEMCEGLLKGNRVNVRVESLPPDPEPVDEFGLPPIGGD